MTDNWEYYIPYKGVRHLEVLMYWRTGALHALFYITGAKFQLKLIVKFHGEENEFPALFPSADYMLEHHEMCNME